MSSTTRTVFYVSDGTGLSAETLGHSLITQFEPLAFQSFTLPYIDSEVKARDAVQYINKSIVAGQERPLVFSTIVKSEIRAIIQSSQAFVIDFFEAFIGDLEQELKMPAANTVGLSHAVKDLEQYNARIDAVHFALQCDDGVNLQAYQSADIILIGVSRSGKTPTCLYLALQFGLRAANYPLTPEDLDASKLPQSLMMHKDKLFGLTITPLRLQAIRDKRRPNSNYAALQQCKKEINQALSLYHHEKIPFLDSTNLSIEELSAHILRIKGLRGLL